MMLNDQFPRRNYQSLSAIAYEYILSNIINGTYKLGSKLPTEVQLSKELKLSRPVLREALARLREDELITSRRGSGSYVIKRPDNIVLQLSPLSNVAQVQRCFEFRVCVEAEAACFAAARRTSAQLKVILNCFESMHCANQSNLLAIDEDFAFHLAVTAAANNQYYSIVLKSLENSIKEGIGITRSLSLRHSASRLRLVQEEHVAIINAIEEKDPVAARDAMKHHLNSARIRMFEGDSRNL